MRARTKHGSHLREFVLADSPDYCKFLSPVLKIDENDIKSPISSALTGSLIHTLLIQEQRTKVSREANDHRELETDSEIYLWQVDIDLAASGIDKLLRS